MLGTIAKFGRATVASTNRSSSRAEYYWAFLSYSHADSKLCEWLQAALENYPIDPNIIGTQSRAGPIPKTLQPIFRDKDEFSAGQSLTDLTLEALARSRSLIVICSPASFRSFYVNEEIRLFKSQFPDRPVIPVIVNFSSSEPSELYYPPALRFEVTPDGLMTEKRIELLAADLRGLSDDKELALAKVVSGIFGLNTDSIFQRTKRIREQNRRRRIWLRRAVRAFIVSAASLLAFGFASFEGFYRQGTYGQKALELLSTLVAQQKVNLPNEHVSDSRLDAFRLGLASMSPIGSFFGAKENGPCPPQNPVLALASAGCLLNMSGTLAITGRPKGAVPSAMGYSIRQGNMQKAVVVAGNGDFWTVGRDGEVQRLGLPRNAALPGISVSPMALSDTFFIESLVPNKLFAVELVPGLTTRSVELPPLFLAQPPIGNGPLIIGSVDGSAIAAKTADGGLAVWRPKVGDAATKIKPNLDANGNFGFLISPHGNLILAFAQNQPMQIFSTDSGNLINEVNTPDISVGAATFTDDEKSLIYVDSAYVDIRKVDIESGLERVRRSLSKSLSSASGFGPPTGTMFNFKNSGSLLLLTSTSGGWPNEVRIFGADFIERALFSTFPEIILQVTLSEDGRVLAFTTTSSFERPEAWVNVVRVGDDGKLVRRRLIGKLDNNASIMVSTDGTKIMLVERSLGIVELSAAADIGDAGAEIRSSVCKRSNSESPMIDGELLAKVPTFRGLPRDICSWRGLETAEGWKQEISRILYLTTGFDLYENSHGR